MKIKQYHCLWQATCSMLLLIAATYATDSRQQPQAEVSAQQIPPKPVKFGDRVAQNEVFLPTPLPQPSVGRQTSRRQQPSGGNEIMADLPAPTPNNQNRERLATRNQSSRGTVKAISVPTESTQSTRRQPEIQRSLQQQSSPRTQQMLPTPLPSNKRRHRPDPVITEHISLPTHPPAENSHLSRRHNAGRSGQNQLVLQQYDVPAVQKSHEATLHKPITPTVGQQRQQQPPNANRSRFSNTNAEQPAAAPRSHSNQQQLTAVATSDKRPKSQQQLSSAARTSSHTNSQHSTSPSSTPRNSNHNALSNRRNVNNIDKSPYQTSFNGAAAVADAGRFPPKTVATPAAQQRSPPANQSSRSNTRKSSSSTAPTTTPRPLFSLPNEYNIFSPQFWSFLNPTTRAPRPTTTTSTTTTTTKKPPKKYIPPQQAVPKEEKINYSKAKTTFHQPTKATHVPEYKDNVPAKRDDGPFRIALPTFNILNPKRESAKQSDKDKRDVEENEDLRAKFNCPRESEVRFQLFPKICKVDDDCTVWNRGEICCEIFGAKSCVSGIPKPLEETSHSPILGLIPRKCPDRPLAELWWEVKECETDMDCWPRVCCPDGRRRYCRTSQPELNTVPVPVQRSFNYLTEYLECTAPPPPIFDLHPKACTSTLDCFPNVCCQEAGLRHCRPPKKSVLTMLANVFNVDLVKRLTQNIVIK